MKAYWYNLAGIVLFALTWLFILFPTFGVVAPGFFIASIICFIGGFGFSLFELISKKAEKSKSNQQKLFANLTFSIIILLAIFFYFGGVGLEPDTIPSRCQISQEFTCTRFLLEERMNALDHFSIDIRNNLGTDVTITSLFYQDKDNSNEYHSCSRVETVMPKGEIVSFDCSIEDGYLVGGERNKIDFKLSYYQGTNPEFSQDAYGEIYGPVNKMK